MQRPLRVEQVGDHPRARIHRRRHLPGRGVTVTDADQDPRRRQGRDRRQAPLHLRGQRHHPQYPRPRRQQARDRLRRRGDDQVPAVGPGPAGRQERSLHVNAEDARARRRIRNESCGKPQGAAQLGHRGGDEGRQERGGSRLRQAPHDAPPPGRVRLGQVHPEIAVDLQVDQAGHEVPAAEGEVGGTGRRPGGDLGHPAVGDQDIPGFENAGLARAWHHPGRGDQQLGHYPTDPLASPGTPARSVVPRVRRWPCPGPGACRFRRWLRRSLPWPPPGWPSARRPGCRRLLPP